MASAHICSIYALAALHRPVCEPPPVPGTPSRGESAGCRCDHGAKNPAGWSSLQIHIAAAGLPDVSHTALCRFLSGGLRMT